MPFVAMGTRETPVMDVFHNSIDVLMRDELVISLCQEDHVRFTKIVGKLNTKLIGVSLKYIVKVSTVSPYLMRLTVLDIYHFSLFYLIIVRILYLQCYQYCQIKVEI